MNPAATAATSEIRRQVSGIASEIVPTLEQFSTVRWVKIYDPAGHTERATGHSDSIPTFLEP